MANGKSAKANGFYPVPDPSINARHDLAAAVKAVSDLQKAAVKREDDLRLAHEDLSRVRAAHSEKLARVRQWAAAEAAKGQRREAKSERKRLNSVRAVDVAAGNVATATAERTAGLLASQLNTTAETLRKQVETTATVQEQKLETLLNPMRIDIRELRESRSTLAGRDEAVFQPLIDSNQRLIESQAAREGAAGQSIQSTGSLRWVIMAGVSFGLLLIAIVTVGFLIVNGGHTVIQPYAVPTPTPTATASP